MANALTLETMSPERVKVVATRSHEPHRRKSRMREIRSYGSGEGPGWVTARPTLQVLFASSGAHPLEPPSALVAGHPAGAPRRQAVHGAAWLWLVLDRRRRMG